MLAKIGNEGGGSGLRGLLREITVSGSGCSECDCTRDVESFNRVTFIAGGGFSISDDEYILGRDE